MELDEQLWTVMLPPALTLTLTFDPKTQSTHL